MTKLDQLCEALAEMDVERDAPMSAHTTFGVGGPADLFCRPANAGQVQQAISAAQALGVPWCVIGNGSNLLVRDGGLRGLVLAIGPRMAEIEITGTRVRAGAGAGLTAISREALRAGLMGLEWACGIPGTLGGACAMNAGAYESCMQQALLEITYLEQGRVQTKRVEPGELGYRESAYASPGRIVLEAVLQLAPDDGSAAARQAEYTRRRREKQPLSEKSAGSTFKRPPGLFAGALIEQAGLKGLRVGGAKVSELHAGFIVNDGGACAADILELIAEVQRRVLAHAGVRLCCEVQIWGEDAL